MYLGSQKTIFGAVSTRGKLNPLVPQPISLTINLADACPSCKLKGDRIRVLRHTKKVTPFSLLGGQA